MPIDDLFDRVSRDIPGALDELIAVARCPVYEPEAPTPVSVDWQGAEGSSEALFGLGLTFGLEAAGTSLVIESKISEESVPARRPTRDAQSSLMTIVANMHQTGSRSERSLWTAESVVAAARSASTSGLEVSIDGTTQRFEAISVPEAWAAATAFDRHLLVLSGAGPIPPELALRSLGHGERVAVPVARTPS